MQPCKYWKDQPDGFHGNCQHPEAHPGDACILNTEDVCLLREETFHASVRHLAKHLRSQGDEARAAKIEGCLGAIDEALGPTWEEEVLE